MKHIAISAAVGAVVVATLIAFGAVTSAQGPNKCLAGKNKCASKEMQGKLKCHNLAEKTGVAVSPACIQKVDDKYTGAPVPAKGCFAKLELKNDGPCVTTGDSTPTGSKDDAFVLDVVTALDPGFPAVVMNKCSAGKKKCVLQKAAAILKCHEKAVKVGMVAADPTCLQKAHDKFNDPVKGCFAKLEAKGSCITTGDTAPLEVKVDNYTTDVLCGLGYTTLNCVPTPTPTPTVTLTPTPTVTATCPPGPVFQGALVPTVGRFTYNLTVGLPGASAACNTNYAGSHLCTYFELQCAQAAGSLVGATDTSAALVTSFWAIDPLAPPLTQCQDDIPLGSHLNWEYGTAHTASRGQRVALTNPTGTLGPLLIGQQCNFSGSSSVGCCQ